MLYPDMAQVAINCFDENKKLFTDPNQDIEKFNLYQGLRALAEAAKQTQQELLLLKQEIEELKKMLS